LHMRPVVPKHKTGGFAAWEILGFGETFVHHRPQKSPRSPNPPHKAKIIVLKCELLLLLM